MHRDVIIGKKILGTEIQPLTGMVLAKNLTSNITDTHILVGDVTVKLMHGIFAPLVTKTAADLV